eukprot:TRINITY_DN6375_c0_g2_i1.p1 TRINITY_DN6375_c0_g2~~TRINITY_DN6375_c0_g2_i1.p1  ORF type:complete len:473 (+),score=49.50 TRINITY_DN6375_c0_g2_i1:126-1544(+)
MGCVCLQGSAGRECDEPQPMRSPTSPPASSDAFCRAIMPVSPEPLSAAQLAADSPRQRRDTAGSAQQPGALPEPDFSPSNIFRLPQFVKHALPYNNSAGSGSVINSSGTTAGPLLSSKSTLSLSYGSPIVLLDTSSSRENPLVAEARVRATWTRDSHTSSELTNAAAGLGEHAATAAGLGEHAADTPAGGPPSRQSWLFDQEELPTPPRPPRLDVARISLSPHPPQQQQQQQQRPPVTPEMLWCAQPPPLPQRQQQQGPLPLPSTAPALGSGGLPSPSACTDDEECSDTQWADPQSAPSSAGESSSSPGESPTVESPPTAGLPTLPCPDDMPQIVTLPASKGNKGGRKNRDRNYKRRSRSPRKDAHSMQVSMSSDEIERLKRHHVNKRRLQKEAARRERKRAEVAQGGELVCSVGDDGSPSIVVSLEGTDYEDVPLPQMSSGSTQSQGRRDRATPRRPGRMVSWQSHVVAQD